MEAGAALCFMYLLRTSKGRLVSRTSRESGISALPYIRPGAFRRKGHVNHDTIMVASLHSGLLFTFSLTSAVAS